jgi:hypothetical protein
MIYIFFSELFSKEKKDLKKNEDKNIIKNNNLNEDKKIKEDSKKEIINSGIEGGEMPMDISASSNDVSFFFSPFFKISFILLNIKKILNYFFTLSQLDSLK